MENQLSGISGILDKAGTSVELKNINYCTKEMYLSALETAGITDARVMISAPYAVSGTGALTGIYKAYEDITGKSLSELAKLAGAEELVLTGELSEYIGSREATEIIRELKKTLDRAQGMTDEEVKEEDVFDVVECGEMLFDPDTGAPLDDDGDDVGRVQISKVGPKVSKAVPLDDLDLDDLDLDEHSYKLRRVSKATLKKEAKKASQKKKAAFESRF